MVAVFALSLNGCSKIFMGLAGMKTPKPLSDEAISRYSKKYHVPEQDGYALDTGYYSFVARHDSAKYAIAMNHHIQPLQALYFAKSGNLEVFLINCYAGGGLNLQWDRDGALADFLPKLQAPLDDMLDINTQMLHLQPLSNTQACVLPVYDHVVFVYWSRWMGRQSKRLIRMIQENCSLPSAKNVKVIYVNNDNLFAGMEFEH